MQLGCGNDPHHSRRLQGGARWYGDRLGAHGLHQPAILLNGLRDYGTAQWDGGDAGCDHLRSKLVSQSSTLRLDGREHLGPYDGEKAVTAGMPFADACGKCGARRIDRQIGLEATPDEYIQTMVAVFREVRRVLRDDGTCWVNMGDSYAGGSAVNGFRAGNTDIAPGASNRNGIGAVVGAKPKDLLMMPARLALALQADGWWLRSDIIWAKPNPMPESVTDRPTSAHEHVFLLTKRSTYYYDQDAVRWEPTGRTDTISSFGNVPSRMDEHRAGAFTLDAMKGRNERNVWVIPTAPFPEAHFATFPPELAERCIKAGCPRDGVVLDPFAGAGTTCLVADRLQRDSIGIELNEAYAVMARNRIVADAPLFAEVAD